MEKKQHPSYGMIRFARSSIGGSGTALFGSSIMHNNVIRLSISKGMMEREGNEDWFLAGTDINDMIVEVEMSYTQFAEAITSLNIGEGIPVTITKVNGTFVEPCPYSDRQKVMRREVDEATRDLVRQLEKRSEEIEKLLDEKRVLSREDRRNIVSTLKNVRQELKSNIPYLQKLFAEQMDKTVTEAKGEFETYLQNKMNSIALAAISEQMKQEEISLNRNMIPELEVQEGGEEAGEMEAGMHMDIEGSNGLFVSMPSYKAGNEYKDICFPITQECRKQLHEAVIGAYEQAISQGQDTVAKHHGMQAPEGQPMEMAGM